jgi:hypothetical protein
MTTIYVVSGILLIAALVCGYFIHDKKKALNTIRTFVRRTVGDILASAGAGMFQTAKVRGKIVCAEPLKSELTEADCVFYEMEVRRKYEKTEEVKDSSGEIKKETRTVSDVVSHNTRQQDFYVDDGTGKMKVSWEGADFEKEQSLDKFVPATESSGGLSATFGSFSLNLSSGLERERTLGYEYREWIVPTNKDVLVVGGIKKGDELYFGRPEDTRYKYLISFRDEAELIQKTRKDLFWLKIGAIVCLVLSISSLIFGLVTMGLPA